MGTVMIGHFQWNDDHRRTVQIYGEIKTKITNLDFSTVQKFITELEIALTIGVLDLVTVINVYEEQPLLFPSLPDRSHIR